jgi:multicomponent Na+:H+ antiporter subunit B
VSLLILRTTARALTPLMLLFSIFLLLRGHNEPGGGFIAGLVTAAAFALEMLAGGLPAARHALRVDPRSLLGAGLLVALASGLPALLSGAPFMTGVWVEPAIPGAGPIKLGTPLLFDIGVYLVVVGVVMTMLFALAEE